MAHEGHTHHGHAPGVPAGVGARHLAIAGGLLTAFLVFEVVAALVVGSLALLADAGHLLTDVGAIGASLVAARLAARPPSDRHTFGLKRAEILSAAANAVTLLLMAGLITFEAVRRLIHPPDVQGPLLIVVALIGVAVNAAATATLARADRSSLNVEAAFQHIVTDLYAFGGTVVAGAVIVLTGFRRADPLASLVVAGLMVRATFTLLGPAVRILVEATPDDVAIADVRSHILELPDVVSVHDLHVWTLTSGLPVVSAHVVVSEACFGSGGAGHLLDRLQECLAGHFDVEHSTFQLEAVGHQDHERGFH